jgi:hypothetical protein
MVDRASIPIGFQTAEGALDPGQILVELVCFARFEMLGWHARADDGDAIEVGFGVDLLSVAFEGEMPAADPCLECAKVRARWQAANTRACGSARRRANGCDRQ